MDEMGNVLPFHNKGPGGIQKENSPEISIEPSEAANDNSLPRKEWGLAEIREAAEAVRSANEHVWNTFKNMVEVQSRWQSRDSKFAKSISNQAGIMADDDLKDTFELLTHVPQSYWSSGECHALTERIASAMDVLIASHEPIPEKAVDALRAYQSAQKHVRQA